MVDSLHGLQMTALLQTSQRLSSEYLREESKLFSASSSTDTNLIESEPHTYDFI